MSTNRRCLPPRTHSPRSSLSRPCWRIHSTSWVLNPNWSKRTMPINNRVSNRNKWANRICSRTMSKRNSRVFDLWWQTRTKSTKWMTGKGSWLDMITATVRSIIKNIKIPHLLTYTTAVCITMRIPWGNPWISTRTSRRSVGRAGRSSQAGWAPPQGLTRLASSTTSTESWTEWRSSWMRRIFECNLY